MFLRSRFRRLGAAAVVAVVVCVVVVGIAGATGTQATATSIRALTVSGNANRPVFTITGAGLNVPTANPKASPSGQSLCPVKIAGNAGLDYGTGFYLIGWDAQPNDSNAQLYAAGRYRSSLNELDCIGIVVLSHTHTKLVFTFGSAYVQYRSQYRTLRNGDVVEVVLNAAAFATVVHYHAHP